MANNRTLMVQALVTNGISVGGMSQLEFNTTFRGRSTSAQDDVAVGAEDDDASGQRTTVTCGCTDITKVMSILAATPGATTFATREANASTFRTGSISSIIWNGMTVAITKEGHATLRLDGVLRYPNSTDSIDDLLTLSAGQSAPTRTTPVTLLRPHNASFDPDGADPAIAPVHVESINLRMSAQTEEDYGDDDVGMTSVDRLPFGPLEGTIVHKDASLDTGVDKAAQLLNAVKGVMTVDMRGTGGRAQQTLTINNLKFRSRREAKGPRHTMYTQDFVAAWTKRGSPDVNYTLTGGTPLFSFA